jgi:hypothetical protein
LRPTVALAAISIALAGCGGGTAAPHPGAARPAAAAVDAGPLLAQTFGPNPAARSGVLSGAIDVYVTGVPRFREPVTLSMDGPFSQASGAPPSAHISLGITVPKGIIGADMILVGNQILFGLGSTAYRIPDAIAGPIRAPLVGSRNALASVLDVFSLAPQRWAQNPRIAGSATIDGTDAIHVTAAIKVGAFFRDAARFAQVLTAFRASDLALLPREITLAARAALVRSVRTATGELLIGRADHVLRRAKLTITLVPSAADRRLLGGISALRIVGNLHVTEVGSAPAIVVPTSLRPYSELKLLLDTLAASARSLARQGKF